MEVRAAAQGCRAREREGERRKKKGEGWGKRRSRLKKLHVCDIAQITREVQWSKERACLRITTLPYDLPVCLPGMLTDTKTGRHLHWQADREVTEGKAGKGWIGR